MLATSAIKNRLKTRFSQENMYFFELVIMSFLINSSHFTDKMCDQISDAILDAHLRQDPDAKVACGEFGFCFLFT